MDCPYPGYVYVDVDGVRALRLLEKADNDFPAPSEMRTKRSENSISKREEPIGYKPDGLDPLIPITPSEEGAEVTEVNKDKVKEAVLKALADRAEVSAALGVIFIGSFLALFVLSHSGSS